MTVLRLPSSFWIVALALAWAGLLTWSSLWWQLASADRWFAVERLQVADAPSGTCPRLDYRRSIRAPFHGRWHAHMERATGSGFVPWGPVFDAERDYDPVTVLPEALNLGLFLGGACTWPDGRWRLRVVWEIEPARPGTRRVEAKSNVFRVGDDT